MVEDVNNIVAPFFRDLMGQVSISRGCNSNTELDKCITSGNGMRGQNFLAGPGALFNDSYAISSVV